MSYVHNRSNPYTNTYNASWRQHPNFSWNSPSLNPPVHKQHGNPNFQQQHASSSNSQNHHHQNFQSNQPPFQTKPPPQSESSSSLEAMIKGLVAQSQAQQQTMIQNQSLFNQQSATIRNLKTQVSQLALNQNSRTLGTLPSNTEVPRDLGKEHVKVVTLRSGKELIETIPKESEQLVSKPETIPMVPVTESPPKPLNDQPPKTTTIVPPESNYPLLFPEEVARKKPIEDEVITGPKTKVVIPYEPQESKTKTLGTLDPSCSTQPNKAIIKPIPLYVPFPQRLRNQKEELQFKKFLEVFKALYINIPLVEAIEQMPSYAKFLKDILSGKEIGKALCDLGASINLMSLSVFNTLGIGEARPTIVTLQLANRSIAYPKGKIEDVLVQVDKFIFPADFVILDFEADKDIPIILGRPFLATGGTLIDV
ncbi:uncharacterized protein LOC112524838 [Cynara cardunculus var. scolymus]|uniref:uncharacterized protein LOC112524838 n=1 Tax=Cynara cardunculus var. scolymus TaxID=59895 RepID=UPI000D62CEAF|nr:uncharacterized protein LOC112524838 [Cynara cardunculus var. scolymus]